MHLLHNPGLELPIVSPETPVAWTRHEIYSAAQSGADTFVRRMDLEFPSSHACGSLKKVLEIADEVIEDAAAHLGIATVGRAWGLYRNPGNIQRGRRAHLVRSDLLPKDHYLVAEVPVVAPAAALSPTQIEDLAPKLASYHQHNRALYYLGDLGSRQCVSGGLATSGAETSPRIWLVDPEPRVLANTLT